MKHNFSPDSEHDGADSPARPRQPVRHDANKRIDPRYSVAAQAFVAIPSLTSRAYKVREISRSGMFLAFKEAQSTLLEYEQNNIERGAHVDIAFAFTLSDTRYRFSVPARITRITKHGIGVQFTTHNPPQLAALRELFEQADTAPGLRAPPDQASEKSRVLKDPPETSAWQDWELLD